MIQIHCSRWWRTLISTSDDNFESTGHVDDDSCFFNKNESSTSFTSFTTPNTATGTTSPVSTLNLNYCSYCSNINYSNFYWYSSISRKKRTNNSSIAEPIDYFNQLWINTTIIEIFYQNKSHQFTIGELYNYITLVIIIGVISIPYIQMYWCTNWLFINDSFHKVISLSIWFFY